MKLSPNSASLTTRGPVAGSFRNTCPGANPSTTTKWLKFQNTINGSRKASRSSGCWLSPLHFRP